MSSEYRPEIDGLRSMAVVPVVLFHAGVLGFSGGYVGVDVFFVISGYLITGILLAALESDQFSLIYFYERRIRRIFPALFSVLFASAICAAWLFFSDELKSFGTSFFASSLFYANYHFMQETGYFAAPAESKPLLHLWSLAIEEQYYVLFPLYLYAARRWLRHGLLALTITLCLASLGYSIWLMAHAPDRAFYSTPARAWELMVGAILVMVVRRSPTRATLGVRSAGGLSLLGFILIIGPVCLYSSATPFPGATAIPPVIGAALILYASQGQQNVISRVLSSAPLRFIGLISYSLYLWHWPVFVFYKTYFIEPLTATQKILMLVSVFILAVVSWRFVELPFRRGGQVIPRRRVVAVGLAVMFAGIACGAGLKSSDGWPGRFSPEVRRILEVRDDAFSAADCRPLPAGTAPGVGLCALGPGNPLTQASFVVWGDSHAEALLPAIAEAARKTGATGLAFVRGGCVALLGVEQVRDGYRDCDEQAEVFMRFLKQNPQLKDVILASRWALYALGERFGAEPGHTVFITDSDTLLPSVIANKAVFERGLVRTMDRLAELDRHVALISQVPEAEFRIPLAMARARHLNHQVEFAPTYASYQFRQAFVEEMFRRHATLAGTLSAGASNDVTNIRPQQMLCDRERCRVATSEGTPIYRDSNHLTKTQAVTMAGLFVPLLAASFARAQPVDTRPASVQ